MRVNDKQSLRNNNPLLGVNTHRFIELESASNSLEIVEELGVFSNDIKKLKEKLNRS